MNKKQIAFLLTTAIMTSAFTGCGAKEQTAASGSGDEPVSISVMLYDRGAEFKAGMSLTDNTLTRFIQDSVLAEKNVKVEYIPVARSEADDKLNAMMAGGNAPDIVFTYDRNMFVDYATKGGITDLTESINQYGETIKTELGEDLLKIGQIDSKVFAVPMNRGNITSRHLGYIRKDWLDALGLEVPQTTQELVDALYAFKEKDPGNVGSHLVPWAMGGNSSGIKYFQTFVTSYVEDVFKGENLWVYQEDMSVLNPEAKEGFKVLNTLYNDGIIAKDFAVDTGDDKYKQDISNGYAGFIVDDNTRPLNSGWLGASGGEWAPVNCFTGAGTEYQGNVSNPLQGMYVMVPTASKDKVDAAVKYMDWLADPENSIQLSNPGASYGEDGIPVQLTKDQLLEQGYPEYGGDYSIINNSKKYLETLEGQIKDLEAKQTLHGKNMGTPFYTEVAEALKKGLERYPVYSQPMAQASKYGKIVQDMCVQLGYCAISAPADQFEAVYNAEYDKILQAGFAEIEKEARAYYESNVK